MLYSLEWIYEAKAAHGVSFVCARYLLGIPYPLPREDIRQGAEE